MTRKNSKTVGLEVECLEERALMTAYIDSGRLIVVGTEARDVMSVNRVVVGGVARYRVNDNGVLRDFNATSIWRGEVRFFGGAGSDDLRCNTGDLKMYANGGAGNDVMVGSAAADTFFGGDGDDSIYGGAGNDYLNGEGGRDRLFGNDGADTLYGGAGRDYLDGGRDYYRDYLNGGLEYDTFVQDLYTSAGILYNRDNFSDFNREAFV